MVSSRFVRVLCCSVLLLLFMPGYAAETFPEFPVHQAASYAIRAQQDGLVIGLETVDDPGLQKTYFHTELAPKGFVPVFVVIYNGSKTESVLLNKARISYDQEGSVPVSTRVSAKGAKATEAAVVAGSPFGAGIAWPLVGQMYAHASQIQQNLMLREMQSQTLSPGASAHGFLYISTPKTGVRKKSSLHIPITMADSGKESIINLSF